MKALFVFANFDRLEDAELLGELTMESRRIPCPHGKISRPH